MPKPIRKSSNKNPPILSHEFIIQNHADIVSCIAMVFVIGLMVQSTSPLASIFISLQHNVTESGEIPLYVPGFKDFAAVFFYTLICIVIHAIIQEYILDRISKKLHLSKSKLAIFSTSGQLLVFYLISLFWGIKIILQESYLPEIFRIWADYPAPMTFLAKLYIIIQLAYNLHELPELYFQRVKREEYPTRALQSIGAFLLLTIPYIFNFNRLLVCLLVFHHGAELIFHIVQMVQTIDKDDRFTKVSRLISSTFHIVARLSTIVLSVLSLWYGFAKTTTTDDNNNNNTLDSLQNGNFNIPAIRLALLGGILILQMYLIFNVINQEIVRSRETKGLSTITSKLNKSQQKKDKKDKKQKKSTREESDLPEVDQNTNKTLRNKPKMK